MTDREALVEAVAANPADDVPRLVFADWLEEHDEPERAEFIRLCCSIAPHGMDDPAHDTPEFARARELLDAHWQAWIRPVCLALGTPDPTAPVEPPRRGWLGRLLRPRAGALAAQYQTDFFDGGAGAIRAWKAGLLGGLNLDRGLITSLDLDLRSAAPCTLDAALAAEPITQLLCNLTSPAEGWPALATPALRRVTSCGLRLHDEGRRVLRSLREMAECPHWPALRRVSVTCPGRERGAASVEVVDALGGLLVRAEELWIASDLVTITRLAASPTAANLRGLNLWFSSLPPSVGAVLAGATFRASLERLELVLSDLDSDRLAAFLAPGWPQLADLNLGANRLGDAGAELLARTDSLPALTHLRLSSNDIGHRGARALESSPLLPRLVELDLTGNRLGDTAARTLAWAVRPLRLERLGLRNNPLTDTARDQIARWLGDRVAV